ncbi:hypothetical protein [Rhodosalinus sp. FB01]|uniref:hypothetical protein n=1 Tax=Rhodosalinus sp. FB01 TaxID=3239194 RepID=UPI0035253B3A
MKAAFLYAEHPASADVNEIYWIPVFDETKAFPALTSKTFLSGINARTNDGFYHFSSRKDAQNYVDNFLVP